MPNKIKVFSRHPQPLIPYPDLVGLQKQSFDWFLRVGLKELFTEISPIKDYSEEEFELELLDYFLDEPKISQEQAKEKELNYEAPLRAKARLKNLKTGEIKEQEVYLGDLPVMTENATFIINGIERVVISQIIRSPGVYFFANNFKGRNLFGAKIIPYRGAWIEFETESDNAIYVKIDRKRKIAATALLKAMDLVKKEDILNTFNDVDTGKIKFIEKTLVKDQTSDKEEALIEIYRRLRPGDVATFDNAQGLFSSMLSDLERYDLSQVGRFKINQRLSKNDKLTERFINLKDIVDALRELVRLNNTSGAPSDDIDSLSNRRLRTIGELLQNRFRLSLLRLVRNIKDKMASSDPLTLTPGQLINPRPIISAINEFFATFPLSQFMDQTNPLAELEHKRRISTTGPGGLSRERAGFEVRDVHQSHYGRICPIQTPEGANIGLVNHLAIFARINELGFLETPYIKVEKGRLTNQVDYLDASAELKFNIAQGSTPYNQEGEILQNEVEARSKGQPSLIHKKNVDYIEVSPQQPFSVGSLLIPFLENDDASRALMGSNMQRQAVACLKPQAPLVGTGLEEKAAINSGYLVVAKKDGVVSSVDANKIVIQTPANQKIEYKLKKFIRSNAGTCINQQPLIKPGQKIKSGDILADGPATEKGRLGLGKNLLVAFLPWGGANFEDAIIISERLLKDETFSSIHIEEFSCDVRETKLGPEVITADIPNVSEEKLKDLDEEGIVRIGAEVQTGDILVGKITPRGEVELTPEEKLLRAIFGEKSEEVKDTSTTMGHGKSGRVISIKVLSREKGDKLEAGIIKRITVEVAKLRKIMAGDKLAGRHGNKGVISKILPEEDMPYLEDGTPVDIILNPLGVISRMNLGQIMETHLGWAAKKLDYYAASPALDGARFEEIQEELKKAGLPESGKVVLYDGRTGEPFNDKITVGYIYMMKLIHLVEDKVHVRAVGPYSLITQQPLGGKAQFGGQRFGEMEVWALEGYGAANTLHELITIKSDDVFGRSATYNAIIKGEKIKNPNVPAAFNVLVRELQGLGLSVDIKEEKEEPSGANDYEKQNK